MRAILFTFSALTYILLANPNCSSEAKVHRVSKTEAIVGIKLTPKEHWHTYWSNPGDAGLALSIELEDAGLKVEAEDFPIPIRFEAMGIVGYGYEKAATFLYRLSGEIPEELKGKASWLVCDATACLPADASFALSSGKESGEKASAELPAWVTQARASQPTSLKVIPLESTQGEGSKLITYSFQTEENVAGWKVFPFNENFSESELGNSVTLEEDVYKFAFDLTGEKPESASFLLTDGKKGYKTTL